MGLPINLPFLKKQPKVEYYLALVLCDEKAAALIFAQRAGTVTIIAKYEKDLPLQLEKTPLDELVEIIDTVISHAEEKLPADTEVVDTVFGVKAGWVEEKKIKKEYLAKLKHVCGELSLSPIGFIVLSEAVAHLIKQEEGAPVTALLTEVGKNVVTVSLFRAGKLAETKDKLISSTPMQAVDEVLKEFEKVEILPSRIILFHSIVINEENKKDELIQQFISHQWSKSLPFLHVPQISILPSGFDGKAIVAGAATQLGFTLGGLQQNTISTEIQTYDGKQKRNAFAETQIKDETKNFGTPPEVNDNKPEKGQVGKEDDDEAVNPVEQTAAESFGFVLNKDITTLPKPAVKLHDSARSEKHSTPLRQTGESVPENEEHIAGKEIKVHHYDSHKFISDEENTAVSEKAVNKRALSFFSFFPKMFHSLKKISLPTHKGLLIVPPLIIFALIGLILLYIYQLKATVTLMVSPKAVNETQKITFSTNSDNDFSQNVIAAKEITVTLSGSSSTDATGEKEVGEKAKGTIILYNSDDTRKTFEEGTVITSEKGLAYVTDKEVTVASASGDIFTGIKSGTAQVNVIANQIGTEYNLPSNSKFSIKDTNVVAAKNEAAFSGGSKKKVTVVTKKDIDKLKADLPKSLEQKAQDELSSKLGSSEELISGFTNVEITKESIDNDIDKEAKAVKLTGTVKFASIAYNRNDLLEFAEASIKERYNTEELSKNDIDTEISGLKDTSETEMTGVAAIAAGLLPKIDTEDIKRELAGKSFQQAQDYGKTISQQVKSVDIILTPNLPFLPQILPRRSGNITVVIQSAQ